MIYLKCLSLFYIILFFLNFNLLLALAERPVDESIDDEELLRNDPLGKAFEYDSLLQPQAGSANNNEDPLRTLPDTEYDLLDNLAVDSGSGLGSGPTVGSTTESTGSSTSGSTVDSTTGSNDGSTIGGSTSSNTTGDIQTNILSETPEVVTNETFQVIVTSEETTSSSAKPDSFPFSKNTVMFIFSFVLVLCLLVCGDICCMSLGRQRTESREENEEKEISLAEKGISSPEEGVSSRKKRFRELIEKEPFKCEKRKKSQELIDLKKAEYKVTSLADHSKVKTLTLSETFSDGTKEIDVIKEVTKVEDDGTVKKISKEFVTFPEQSPSATQAEVAEVLDTMASIQRVGEKLIKDQVDHLKLAEKKSQEVIIKGKEMLKESQTPSEPVSTPEQSPAKQSSPEQVQVEQVAAEQKEVTIEPVTQQESQVLRKVKITKPSLEAITAVTPKRPEKLLTMMRPESVQELIDFKTSEYKVTELPDHGKMETITVTETFPDGTKKMEILKEITRVEDDGTDRLVKRSISKELITFPKQNIQQTEQELANLLQPITSIDQRTKETVKKQVAELSLIDQAKDLLEKNKEQVVSSEIQLTEPVTEQKGEIPYEKADWEKEYIPSYEGKVTETQDESSQTESVSSDERNSSSSTEKSESSEEKKT